jgi:hypothetical protein
MYCTAASTRMFCSSGEVEVEVEVEVEMEL